MTDNLTDESGEARARGVVAELCGDDPCSLVDARSCGCFSAVVRALAQARAEERERCAKVVDEWAANGFPMAKLIAIDIRSLGAKP